MLLPPGLTRPATLWVLFAATVVLTALFPFVSAHFDIILIDGISSPQSTREIIAGFSPGQRTAHAWITGTLDVAYPLAYGLLFAGAGLQFFPTAGRYLALAPLVCIPVDLLEGLVQILALTDTADWVDLKAFLTPLKLLLFACGLLTLVAGVLRWVYRQARS
jgi:hypothetical protein